jgi:proteasome lid subunit RPN8/RPN11
VLAAIRAHARSVPDGFESVGRIVATGDRALDYLPLRNQATRPGVVVWGSSWRRVDGERSIVVHSHPHSAAIPSRADLAHARGEWLGVPYGIYSLRDDELALFAIAVDRRSFTRLPLVVEAFAARRDSVDSSIRPSPFSYGKVG